MSKERNEPLDFSTCQISYKGYHGADEKRSILINDKYYMLKISEELEDDGNQSKRSFSAAPLSEHIACEILIIALSKVGRRQDARNHGFRNRSATENIHLSQGDVVGSRKACCLQ